MSNYTIPRTTRELQPLPLHRGGRVPEQRQGLTSLFPTAKRHKLSLSINSLYAASSSFTRGELEGAKPASNQIKCRAKPCLARRAWSEATIFVPQGGTKITTLFQAVERAKGFFDSLSGAVPSEPPRSQLVDKPSLWEFDLSSGMVFSRFSGVHNAHFENGTRLPYSRHTFS